MLFHTNEALEVTGFGGMAGPGSHFHEVVEVVMSRCHLFHLYAAIFESETCDHINRHFISTKIDFILELIKDDRTESASIFLHQSVSGEAIENTAKLDLVQTIYQIKNKTNETEPAYLYVIQSGEEVFDFLYDFRGQEVQKTIVYKHGDSSFFKSKVN